MDAKEVTNLNLIDLLVCIFFPLIWIYYCIKILLGKEIK
jgi:hypothetical protein